MAVVGIASEISSALNVIKMTDTNSNRKFRTEKAAPEGGWGYLIAIGLTLPFVNIGI